MSANDRKLDERAGLLLRAGSPSYPEDMDRRLQERLARTGRERRPGRLGLARPGRARAASLAAATLLVTAGLAWWLFQRQNLPVQVSQGPAVAAVGQPRPLPVPLKPPAVAPNVPSRPQAGRRTVNRSSGRSAAPREPLRMEFAIPEKEITILWEQRSEFDLATLLASR